MSNVMVVAAREIRARKLIFLTAPAWGVLVAVMGSLHHDWNAVVTAAAICALVFGVVMSFVVGSGLVGRELAERRLSFYFARPISGASIWGGKFVGGLAIVIASQVLVLAPSLIGFRIRISSDDVISVAVVLALPIGLLALGMVAGVAFRSKSLWVGVDLVVLIGTGFLARWAFLILDPRSEFGLSPFFATLSLVGAGIAALILVAASAAAVIAGRCELLRAHRTASLVILALLPAAFGGVVWAHWFVSPAAADLIEFQKSVASPDGKWQAGEASFHGRGSMTMAALVSTDRRHIVNAGAFYGSPSFSADGKVAAWLSPDGSEAVTVVSARLDTGEPRMERSKVLVFGTGEIVPDLRLSPAGDAITLRHQSKGPGWPAPVPPVTYRLSDGAIMP